MKNIREDSALIQNTFQHIGMKIAQIIPDKWERVVYGFFLSGADRIKHQQIWAILDGNDDYTNLMQEYWEDDVFLAGIELLEEICSELQRNCRLAHDDWSEMSFSMLPNGEFSVDFGYEKINDYSAHYVIEWQSQYLV